MVGEEGGSENTGGGEEVKQRRFEETESGWGSTITHGARNTESKWREIMLER